MQEKSVHIVFQILNFLHSDNSKKYNLLPIDKFLLITLASHKGIKGIFPMQETLSEELGITRRHLRNRIRYLEKAGLILVQKVGRHHHYYFKNLSTIEELQFPYQDTNRGTTVPLIGELQYQNRGTTVATNNKDKNKSKNRERALVPRALPLSDYFLPNEKAKALCKERGLAVEDMAKKFILLSKSQARRYADAEAAFELFVMNEKKNAGVANLVVIPKTVKDEAYEVCKGCHRPLYYCSCHLASKETNLRCLREITEKLSLRKG